MITKHFKPKPGEEIEKAQKLIIAQQHDIEKEQKDINKALEKVKEASALILIQIDEMRSGKIRVISRELEEAIKRSRRIAFAIDQKVEDEKTTTKGK